MVPRNPRGANQGPLNKIVDDSWNLHGHYIQVQPPCIKVKHCTLGNICVFHAVKTLSRMGTQQCAPMSRGPYYENALWRLEWPSVCLRVPVAQPELW